MDISKITQTQGGHKVRNLKVVKDQIIGQVWSIGNYWMDYTWGMNGKDFFYLSTNFKLVIPEEENDPIADKIKEKYGEDSIATLETINIENLIAKASLKKEEARANYLQWQIRYEERYENEQDLIRVKESLNKEI